MTSILGFLFAVDVVLNIAIIVMMRRLRARLEEERGSRPAITWTGPAVHGPVPEFPIPTDTETIRNYGLRVRDWATEFNSTPWSSPGPSSPYRGQS